jgi:hypothetical protein
MTKRSKETASVGFDKHLSNDPIEEPVEIADQNENAIPATSKYTPRNINEDVLQRAAISKQSTDRFSRWID